jgi:hypothetical protein
MPPITITNLPFNDDSVNITTNTITVGDNSNNIYVTKNVVTFTSTGTLPTGLLTDTSYIINTATSTGDLDTITLFEPDGVTSVIITETTDILATHTLTKIGNAGSSVTDGYKSSSSWNNILDWFGTNNGLNESPYTFQSILQFKDDPVPDTIFQYLSNVDGDTTADDYVDDGIPEGEVFFDWGIIDSKPYFTFKTYGEDELFYTFTAKNQLTLNITNIYKFVFVLYDNGHAGMFGYTINDGPMIALETERE